MEAGRRRGGMGQAQQMSRRWRDERGIVRGRERERGPTYTLYVLTADGFLSGKVWVGKKKKQGRDALLL